MNKSTRFVGLDDSKDFVQVAVADGTPGGEVRDWGVIASGSDALAKLVRRLGRPKDLHFAYEAGPCGYGMYRDLLALGAQCIVAAPSRTPRKPGERIKNDRRDAIALARLHRAGELTPVWVPDAETEAMRDLTRTREDVKCVQTRARQRLQSFLLRHGRRYPGLSFAKSRSASSEPPSGGGEAMTSRGSRIQREALNGGRGARAASESRDRTNEHTSAAVMKAGINSWTRYQAARRHS